MGILNMNVMGVEKMIAKRQELFLAVSRCIDIFLGFPGIEAVDYKTLEKLAGKRPLQEGEVGLGVIGEGDDQSVLICIGASNGTHLIIADEDGVSFTQASFAQDKIVEGLFTKVILREDASDDLKELLKTLHAEPMTRTAFEQTAEEAAAARAKAEIDAEQKTEMSFKEKLATITSPRRPINPDAAAASAAASGPATVAEVTRTVAVMTDPSTSDLAGLEGAGSVIVIRGGEVEKPKQ